MYHPLAALEPNWVAQLNRYTYLMVIWKHVQEMVETINMQYLNSLDERRLGIRVWIVKQAENLLFLIGYIVKGSFIN
jgi:hypothetical protein